jgi:lauroyl/myristoyl acyltransferase
VGKRKIIVHLIEDFMIGLFYLTKALTYVVPPSVLRGVYNSVGYAFYYARPRMRRDLLSKISEAMPEISDNRELVRIGRGACAAMVRPVLEGVLFQRFTDRFMSELRVEGMENFDRADAEGNGLMVYTMHLYTTIMLCHAVMARLGKSYTVIGWHPDVLPVPRYAKKMADMMMEIGCDKQLPVIYAGPGRDAVGPMKEVLARGGRIGLTIDVPGKCIVPLFGRPAAIADGIAQLSYDSGAAIIPISLLPTGRGFERKITVYEPIACERTGDRRKDVTAIMEKAAAGEEMIRGAPEQWMCWFGLWRWWEKARELQEQEGH